MTDDERVTALLRAAHGLLACREVESAEAAFAEVLADVELRDRSRLENALTRALLSTHKPTTRAALEEAVRRRE